MTKKQKTNQLPRKTTKVKIRSILVVFLASAIIYLLIIATGVLIVLSDYNKLGYNYSKIDTSAIFPDTDNNSDTTSPSDIAEKVFKSETLENILKEIDDKRQTDESSSGSSTGNTTSTGGYPSTILSCTRSGNDLLVLVNKQYKLPSSYAPSDLVPISNSGIRTTKSGLYVRNIMISDLKNMADTMKSAGIDVAALSAYRSYSTQQATYDYWVAYNGGDTAAADTISARPGHSQHQLGTAVDFTSNEISDQLGQQFGNTSAGQWLAQHSWKYGFVLSFPSGWEQETGFSYEPWHYRYIGKDNASEWHASGMILELWLRTKN
ncbi:M15 family metallopeptidase [Candidatus Dojkabacteria bacterium]|nr:M15 family metallopeptidase [Candidatus Dojkabacteria bacterium]